MTITVVIRGESGSGKSTLAQLLTDTFHESDINFGWVEADHYFMDKNGNYNYVPYKQREAHEVAKKRYNLLKNHEVDVIVLSNTSTRHWEIENYLGTEEMKNGKVVYVRAIKAPGTKGKAPDDVIKTQRERYEPIPKEIQVDAISDLHVVLNAIIKCSLNDEERMGCDIIPAEFPK